MLYSDRHWIKVKYRVVSIKCDKINDEDKLM